MSWIGWFGAGVIVLLAVTGVGLASARHVASRLDRLPEAHPVPVATATAFAQWNVSSVSGQVVTPEGKPAPGARVAWVGSPYNDSDSFRQYAAVTTDKQGKFAFVHAKALWEQCGRSQSTQLLVETKAWGLTFRNLPQSEQPVTITLDAPTTLSAKFIAPDGKPVQHLSVSRNSYSHRAVRNLLRLLYLSHLPDPLYTLYPVHWKGRHRHLHQPVPARTGAFADE